MLAIAVPVMLSNVSTPLTGAIDTAVVGQMPDPSAIGAVALGALIFNFVFWGFGFLRMGTTGLSAQALGAADSAEVRASLGRALLIALAIGALLVAAQWPIREIAFALLEGSERVEVMARAYFDVRIWAAPATLVNYALLGWFIGLGRAGAALALQLLLNLTNMVLSLVLVLGLGLGVQGVALGTLAAELLAAFAGLLLAARQLRRAGGCWERARLLGRDRLRRTLAVNGDILVRSLSLIMAFVWFTAQGARQGDTILAANALLMHFVGVAAYFLDGLAFAAEALVGRAAGAADRGALIRAARVTTGWALGVALVACGLFALAAPPALNLLTVDEGVRASARSFLPWAVLAPLVGVWCFQLDGIFIGATRTAQMRNAMLLSLAIFLAAWWALTPFGNHGLWASLYVLYAARALTLLAGLPSLMRAVPPAAVRAASD